MVATTSSDEPTMASMKRTVSRPSRTTATKARPASASVDPRSSAACHAGLQLALHGPALAAHPEEHPGQHDDRQDSGDALEGLLRHVRQLADSGEDHDTHGH